MIEFHDPKRGRFVRLREDNANAIRQYEEWGWTRVDVAPVVEPEPIQAAPAAPAIPRRPKPKAKAKK